MSLTCQSQKVQERITRSDRKHSLALTFPRWKLLDVWLDPDGGLELVGDQNGETNGRRNARVTGSE